MSLLVFFCLPIAVHANQGKSRLAAENLFAEGERLYSQGTAESFRKAIEKYEEALGLWRSTGDRQQEASTLFKIGLAYESLRDLRKALDFMYQALPLYRALGDRRGEANAAMYIGLFTYSLGEPQNALGYLDQALPLWREVGDLRGEARTVSNLGVVNYVLGDNQKALEYYNQALPLRRASNDRAGEASTLHNIGIVYQSVGDNQKGLEYYLQALSLCRTAEDRQIRAYMLGNIGKTYNEMGEPHKALEYFRQALEIHQAAAESAGQGIVLDHIGSVYGDLGDHQKALGYYMRALRLLRAVGYRRMEASTLNNIAAAYHSSGGNQKALDYYNQALAMFRAMPVPAEEANSLNGIGTVHDSLGDRQKALDYYSQALALRRAIGDPGAQASTLASIARVERDLNNLTEARARIEAALRITEVLRSKAASQQLRTSYFASKQSYYDFYIDLLMRLDERQPAAGYDRLALEASERSRSRSLLDLLAEASIDIEQGISPELKRRERSIQANISRIQSRIIKALSEQAPDSSRTETLEKELEKVEAEREQLEIEIRQKHPGYADLNYPAPLGVEAIQALLDEETALLEYTIGKEGSFLFVVSREGILSYRLAQASEISRLVAEVRSALAQPGRREFGRYSLAAHKLYDMLIAPAATVLNKKRNILIAPDAALYYLPFEALLATDASSGGGANFKGLAYLVRQWAISYVPSASVLSSLRKERAALNSKIEERSRKKFVAFADPVYGTGARIEDAGAGRKQTTRTRGQRDERGVIDEEGILRLGRLRESGREVTEIARRFGPDEVAIYLGQAAREENVKGNELMSSARWIHFATHGLISEARPHYSGLVLTLDSDPKEDGLLQVYEAFNLKLNADLIVLSACKTGLGKEVRGEGIIGLTRAFLYAGASSVAVSLWQVADHSTADLMVRFYQLLDGASGTSEALRQAKLTLIESNRYSHPYYWAPFVLVGEPE